jgi:autotransporter-associated beta strand protein
MQANRVSRRHVSVSGRRVLALLAGVASVVGAQQLTERPAVAQVANTNYFLDVNGTAAGFGLAAGGVYQWNGTNQYFNGTSAGTGGTIHADLIQNPVTGAGNPLTLSNIASGDYTVEVSGNRWLQRIDFQNNGTTTFTGAGTNPTLNIISGGNNSFIGAQGGGSQLVVFDSSLNINAYGPVAGFSAGGGGRTMRILGNFNRFDRGLMQVNFGVDAFTAGIFVAASNTSVVNTNGAVLNAFYLSTEGQAVSGTPRFSNYVSRKVSDQLSEITGQVGSTVANLGDVTSSTSNYNVNLATAGATLTSGTVNTANAVYTFTLGGNVTANTARFYNTLFLSGSAPGVADTGGYVVNLNGNTMASNGLLVIQQPLTVTGTGSLTAGSANELTIMAARNINIAANVVDNGNPVGLAIMGTRGGHQFFLSGANTFSGPIHVGNGTLNLASGAAAGLGSEIVLNQATLVAQQSMTVPHGIRASATTVNTVNATSATNTFTAGNVAIGRQARLTLTNGQFSVGTVTYNADTTLGQLLIGNNSSLAVAGGMAGPGLLQMGTSGQATNINTTSSISGPSTGWNGSYQQRGGTVTFAASVVTGNLTAFGVGSGVLNVNGTVNVSQQAFQDVIIGEQSGAAFTSATATFNIAPAAAFNIIGPTGTRRPINLANGAGSNEAFAFLNVSGSFVVDGNGGDFSFAGNPFRSNRSSIGTTVIESGGLISIGGTNTGNGNVYLAANNTATGGGSSALVTGTQQGTVTVKTGGILQTSRTITQAAPGTATGAASGTVIGNLTLDGGMLRGGGAANPNWVASTITKLAVTNNGGIFDSNGADLTIVKSIEPSVGGGTGGITKQGVGVLTVAAVNTHGGMTTVQGTTGNFAQSVLAVPAPTALGALSTVTLNQGSLRLLGGYGATFTHNLIANSTTTFNQLEVAAGGDNIAWTGTLTGSGNFYKAGPGRLVLPNINPGVPTYTGTLGVRNGTVDVLAGTTVNLLGRGIVGLGSNGAGANTMNWEGTGVWGSGTDSGSGLVLTQIHAVGDQNTFGSTLNILGGALTIKSGNDSAVATGGLLVATANITGQTVNATVDVSGGVLTLDGGWLQIGGSRDGFSGSSGSSSNTFVANGTMIVRGTGQVNVTANTAGVFLGQRSFATYDGTNQYLGSVTGTLDLRGGVFSTQAPITRFSGLSLTNATGTVIFDGGVLELASDNADVSAVAGLVRNGGAVLSAPVSVSDAVISSDLAADSGSTGGISKRGAGRITLSGNLSVAGNYLVEDGRLTVTRPLSIPTQTLTVDPGAIYDVAVDGYAAAGTRVGLDAASITVDTGGRVNVLAVDRSIAANHGVLITDVLDLTPVSGTTFGGTLDLANNNAILQGNAAGYATIRSMMRGGVLGTGGITSSTRGLGIGADAHATLAAVVNADAIFGLPLFSSFVGQPVTTSDVLVMYTYAGDTNLDGTLTTEDFNAVLNGFTNSLTGWENGDVNYDGVVDGSDWSLFINAYNYVLGGGLPFGDAGTGGAIPEPASASLLLLASTALLSRRRR